MVDNQSNYADRGALTAEPTADSSDRTASHSAYRAETSASNRSTIDSQTSVKSLKKQPIPKVLQSLLASADVSFNGGNPWDIQVLDSSIYRRILADGSLGLGETYMDGLWRCDDLDGLLTRLLAADVEAKLSIQYKLQLACQVLLYKAMNRQSVKRAYRVGEVHYDIGNDLFEKMLDPSMNYSCGYWANTDNLAQAQQDKMELICRKLQLQRGDKVLEVGCGWGGLAAYMAEHYDVEVIGLTISKEQKLLAEQRCQNLAVEIRLQDYRVMAKEGYALYFDKVVSVGMFEHVGLKNYPVYFDAVAEMMKPEGLFLLHTIGSEDTCTQNDPWIEKYIFPNGKTPSMTQLSKVLEKRLVVEDWHNFGQDYDTTLMAWWQKFNQAWPSLEGKYSDRFYRMWEFYLKGSAAYFRSRKGLLWQLLLTKPQRAPIDSNSAQPVYRSVR